MDLNLDNHRDWLKETFGPGGQGKSAGIAAVKFVNREPQQALGALAQAIFVLSGEAFEVTTPRWDTRSWAEGVRDIRTQLEERWAESMSEHQWEHDHGDSERLLRIPARDTHPHQEEIDVVTLFMDEEQSGTLLFLAYNDARARGRELLEEDVAGILSGDDIQSIPEHMRIRFTEKIEAIGEFLMESRQEPVPLNWDDDPFNGGTE